MFRKSYLYLVLAAAIALTAQMSAYSQTTELSGTVVLQKADKTTEPVSSAAIDVYRTDMKGRFPSSKTQKNGEFRFIGVPYGAEYVLSISAPNCEPILFSVKAGQEKLVITMYPGDGRKFTEAEARQGAAASKPGDAGSEISEEERKAQAELAKKNEEINAKNEKTKNADAIATRANKEGYTALKADPPNFDLAISKFSEGIEAVPDYVDSTPIMLNGKIEALKGKGHLIYKEGTATADRDLRRAKWDEANKSYDEGLEGFQRAIALLKTAAPTTDTVLSKRRETVRLSLYTVATEIHRLKAVTGVDVTKTAEASAIVTEYIALEPDLGKKLEAQMVLGNIMLRTGDFEKAVQAYRQVLTAKPDHAEATGQLGLSLFGLASLTEPTNKEMEQEGLNYMQKYTEMSPVSPTDTLAVKELKESIKQTVDYLKTQKMAPQKVPSTPKKKN
ncbi:MAG: tetratricopeptide repeat protein [Chloracidobacterium sp.]|nr:tetratricopeptide repeat protein [Chloracidobacterium sp.]